jgi:gluconokinase
MRGGVPLSDADRWPWLQAIGEWLDVRREEDRHCVVACSALKRVYREVLRRGRDDVKFVYLQAPHDLVASRLGARQGHYMPPSLLKSQYETLEEPNAAEGALTIGVEGDPDEVVERIERHFCGKRSQA